MITCEGRDNLEEQAEASLCSQRSQQIGIQGSLHCRSEEQSWVKVVGAKDNSVFHMFHGQMGQMLMKVFTSWSVG